MSLCDTYSEIHKRYLARKNEQARMRYETDQLSKIRRSKAKAERLVSQMTFSLNKAIHEKVRPSKIKHIRERLLHHMEMVKTLREQERAIQDPKEGREED
jgi:hypothetical protein